MMIVVTRVGFNLHREERKCAKCKIAETPGQGTVITIEVQQ
jgi:hypothetical protein